MGRPTDWYQRGITKAIFQYISTPQDNNNNTTIENFINESISVITELGKGCNTALAVGDFNINLLQLNEREKYANFLKLRCKKEMNSWFDFIIQMLYFKIMFMEMSDSASWVCTEAWKMGILSIFCRNWCILKI